MRRAAPWWHGAPPVVGKTPRDPLPHEVPDPHLTIGTRVWLVARRDHPRRITEIVWHRHRAAWTYIVETSTPGGQLAYWFADQLEVADP